MSYEDSITVVLPKIYKMEANMRKVIALIGRKLANGVGMTLWPIRPNHLDGDKVFIR